MRSLSGFPAPIAGCPVPHMRPAAGQCPDCPACHEWPLAIDGIRSPFRFEGVMRKAVHQFKYQGLSASAQPLAELLVDYWRAHRPACDVIVPVPLHPQRQRQRGYNPPVSWPGGCRAS